MEEILGIIVSYVSIWAPALVSILGVVVTVLGCVAKTRAAIKEFKEDTILTEINSKLVKLTNENEQLVKTNKLLLEQITHIKGYADTKGD